MQVKDGDGLAPGGFSEVVRTGWILVILGIQSLWYFLYDNAIL